MSKHITASNRNPFKRDQKFFLGWAILVFFTLIAYYPAFQAGVLLDDKLFYLEDPLVETSEGLLRIWLEPQDNNKIWSYVPISRTTFWLERQFWGLNLKVSHGINIILHLLSALLLWGALVHFKIRGAWLIGMLFALHPVHVQSVAWIAERRNVVASIFYILAFWSYFSFEKNRQARCYGVALLLFLCALLSKTSTIMFPIVLVFCRVWFRNSWHKSDLMRLLPFFLLALAAGVVRIWFETHSLGASDTRIDLTFLQRLLLAGHVPFFYFSKFIIPYPLVFTYSKWALNPMELSLYFPLISIGGILGILLWHFRSWGRGLFLGLAAFGVTLFPVLGFFNIAWTQFSYVTDHWAYLPSIPILILIVPGVIGFLGAIEKMLPMSVNKRHSVKVVGWGGIFIVLGGLTWNQTLIYQNQKTLWLATLEHNPNSWVAHTVLGEEYLLEKNYHQSLQHSNNAFNLKPNNIFAYLNRGLAHFYLGDPHQAILDFDRALQIDPESMAALFNRAMALSQTPQIEQAIDDYTNVLKSDPHHLKAAYNRAALYFRIGSFHKALQDYDTVLKLNPQLVDAYFNRGMTHFFLKQYDSALIDLDQAIQRSPDPSKAKKMKTVILQELEKNEN